MNLNKHIFQDEVMPTAIFFLQLSDMSWKDYSNFGHVTSLQYSLQYAFLEFSV